jgi:oligopeptide/dipeptide ABC transporter ATP-binding protein
MNLLEISDLNVVYPGHRGVQVRAVAGADISVATGQIVALVGESGCGKSSLGRAAVGLVKPHSGSVRFDGRPLTVLGRGARPLHERKLQMIFQDPFSSLNPRRKVGDLIAEGGEVAREAGETAMSVAECLRHVGLDPAFADRYPHQFSGGQRQRIAIARALAARPRCLVADEPISALDASAQASVANLLVSLVREFDMGLLLISHDLAIVRTIADITAVMYLGKIVETGPSRDIWRDPAHPYTRGLIGAIPRPDGAGRLPADLPGDVPDPARPPSGCRFHPRCPIAVAECSQVAPATRAMSDARTVACHLAGPREETGSAG